ncbi:lipopolysaccharide biosynthesis protein [Curtobacterium sp. RRHDQ66]|uniref:lipopolysaccharide biosynthesis protein n=1 Tax=Curtobacterium guangdongense TaxID=3413380 RepID=UPI003BF2D92C
MRSRRRTLPAVLTILTGTLVGQGMVVAVSPLLTRSYSAADFGALSVVTATASVLGAGATFGTDRALAVARDEHTVRALTLLGFVGALSTGAAVTAVLGAERQALACWFSAPALVELWWVVPVTTAVVALQRIVSARLARARRYEALAVRNAGQGIGQTACNLLLAPLGPIGLIGGLAVGRLVGLIGTARPGSTRPPSGRAVRHAIVSHRRFLLLTPWSAMLNVVGQQAPWLVIAAVHGSVTAGFVALTTRVLGSPVGMVADAVAQWAAGAFGQRVRSGAPVRDLLVRLCVRLALLGVPAVALVVLAGPELFAFVFGPGWRESGRYAQILVPAVAVQLAVSPLTQLLGMLGRQPTQLVWDASRLIATTAAVLVPSVMGAPMPVVLAALSAAMIGSYLVVLCLVVRAAH